MNEPTIGKRQLRSFGLIVGGGFTVISLWPLAFRGETPRIWALALALLLSSAALVAPSILKHPFRVWMAIGAVLAWINTRILLGAVYYSLFVPMAMGFRLIGKDPMLRKLDPAAESYRIPSAERPASHMLRQY